MNYTSAHKFHIPVMGLAYTIDSPIKVARFGISSAISIVEDRLIEMMRKHYYPTINQAYKPISTHEEDYRAKRITDYLNLINTIVKAQVEKLKQLRFEAGSEIEKYFEMLPEDNSLKQFYRSMTKTHNPAEKEKLESFLREQISPGSIDVNIMTKVDRNNYDSRGILLENGSDAVAALRGFVKSNLDNSSVVFSAGLNPRLYNYLENCTEFDADENGRFAKKVIVKVSDYRSALIQGKYLAKKGIWVSEFRIESGLNCGGHAFATDGYLLGPILEEFKTNRQELIDSIFDLYQAALLKKNGRQFNAPHEIAVSVQGGIGTHEEDNFLHQQYNITSTGWGTPFLLVPEATTVDDHTLKLLSEAKEKDVVLSRNSPLGVRFHYLKGTSSENEKLLHIKEGKPGSPCTEKHLALNTEFSKDPICTASKKYQKLKLEELKSQNLPEQEYQRLVNNVLDKECLCVGLSNSAAITYKETFVKNRKEVNICPGPNIANFSRVVSLQTMTDHIYGRKNLVTNPNRPHMFIAELHIYIDYLKSVLEEDLQSGEFSKRKKFYTSFYQNLKDGIKYYRRFSYTSEPFGYQFVKSLDNASTELDALIKQYALQDVNS
ncbi:hypothetical protein [Flavihumibacter profundi]|uniref:hypothetical protein n=1 Tax=Flavihumibacter profundi TaxID=2716883 RepID=UPI001CC5A47F|nr:hypothetical protein [Flavihumibacter profundi]MBZ5857418.1 hypothetical protein [Flavihumibacter profundi]